MIRVAEVVVEVEAIDNLMVFLHDLIRYLRRHHRRNADVLVCADIDAIVHDALVAGQIVLRQAQPGRVRDTRVDAGRRTG